MRVTEHQNAERFATWSLDGQRLAFFRFSAPDEFCGIFSVPILGGSAERLADGSALLFSMIDHSDDEVMTVDLADL